MNRTARPLVFIGGTSEPGGLHVHTADVALAAAASGRPVTIVCPSIDHFSPMLRGSPVQVRTVPPRDLAEPPRRYWPRVLDGFRHADAALCRGKLAEGCAGDLLAIRRATRRLLTIEHREVDNPARTARDLLLHGLAMRLTVYRSIAVSEAIAESARRDLHLPRRMIACCLNWYDPDFRPPTPAERAAARTALGAPPDACVIGYHGRLAPEKRVETLIDAFAAARARTSAPLMLALIGDGWKRRELEARLRERGVADNTVITGWIPNPSRAVAALDISVLPSLGEGFPLGLLEAMATGIACLAHPMSSTTRIITPGRNGHLADLADPAAFTEALVHLIALGPDGRAALGHAAAIDTSRDFSRAARLPAVLRALGINHPPTDLPDRPRHLEFVR
jgi:glycosyltransferase involved in cell wall biosynthesis